MKSLIYGYGETGKSFERYLNKNNKKFEIFDNNLSNYKKEFNLQDFEKIFCSPGIPKDIYKKLFKQNKNIYTDLDIFFKEDNSIKIGITGTNRKSTTAYHLKQIFDNFEPSNLIGNIGNPMLDFMNNNKKFSIIELSSFQLDKMKENKLDFGILLNIDVDHIDYHGSINSYHDAKKKILLAKNSISYETDPYKLFEWITDTKPKKIKLKNLPYRYQMVANNVINDSKSTNYHSLSYALKEAKNFFKGLNFVLIVCGDPKKENFRNISLHEPEEVFIFGVHSKDIDKCINHPKKTMMSSLSQTLETIYKQRTTKNILFSPGYPSGKDFKNFKERGEHFNLLLKNYIS
jgi:UDP-N-acetylmuramoylalanine--D-glutamate ligase